MWMRMSGLGLGLGLGFGTGLDSNRGCRTSGHAEACGFWLLNTTSRVGKVGK